MTRPSRSTSGRRSAYALAFALLASGCTTTRHFEFPSGGGPDPGPAAVSAGAAPWALGEVYVRVDPVSAPAMNIDDAPARQELERFLRDELPRRVGPSSVAPHGPATVTVDLETTISEKRNPNALVAVASLGFMTGAVVGAVVGGAIASAAKGHDDTELGSAIAGEGLGGLGGAFLAVLIPANRYGGDFEGVLTVRRVSDGVAIRTRHLDVEWGENINAYGIEEKLARASGEGAERYTEAVAHALREALRNLPTVPEVEPAPKP